ncbi:5-carboxymethyl-2-oxo-hex-3- ene-1,7-dioate decarboxylase [Cupriavidus basilensis]|uniref:5-carboxymethyl-2-oxo-hex-3-ene-1,7-dioate decarboxylase n=2 Tax=Cupriavidus basilensis TaxID=68895 RepID=A0A0C4YJ38_9BURK|nr:5-carboxymethyl-2-oxo-hex-3- ene-1,7-dioate decarboxylase [Cupriavidus basilensis]
MRQARIAAGGRPVRAVPVDGATLLPLDGGRALREDEFMWQPAITGTVYGTLLNFKGALAALGDSVNAAPYQAPPAGPILYIKPANTLAAHGSLVELPPGQETLEIGAALGIVIGRRATRIDPAQAGDYIAGYTVVSDVSVPHASYYRPAVRHKCRDGYCPIGPWVMTREQVGNADALSMVVRINGEERQRNHTGNLLRPVAQLLADVTAFMSLEAGDVLLAGVPEGAPLVRAGDMVEIEIEQVGRLRHGIKAAPGEAA